MSLIITDNATPVVDSVDLTKCNPRVNRTGVNPVIIIALPTKLEAMTTNQFGINLRMITESIEISFTLTDGIGTPNWLSGTTKFEKLWRLFKAKGTEKLTWGGLTENVLMNTLSTTVDPGHKDIIDCTMKLYVIQNPKAPT